VFFIGSIAPTPLIMFAVKKLETKFGIAITASHNPADYNGIKLFTEGGRDASEEVTNKLEGIIQSIDVSNVKRIQFEEGVAEGIIQMIDPFNDYIDTILNMINVDIIRKKGLKIHINSNLTVYNTFWSFPNNSNYVDCTSLVRIRLYAIKDFYPFD